MVGDRGCGAGEEPVEAGPPACLALARHGRHGTGVSLAPRLSLYPHRPDVVVLPMAEPSFARAITVWTLPQMAVTSPVAELVDALREAATALTGQVAQDDAVPDDEDRDSG